MRDTTVSFMRSICAGEIEEEVLFPFPTLSDEEREILAPVVESVDDLLEGHAEDFRAWDVAGEIPAEFLQEMREFGLFGLIVPESDGGLGFGNMAYSRTIQQVARHDASVAVTVCAHSSIGMRGLKLYGTEDQKKRYYDRLANGELIAAFCLTEPEAGSDAQGIQSCLVDLGHNQLTLSSDVFPLGVANLAMYVREYASNGGTFEVRLFREPEDLRAALDAEVPDVLGLSSYSWNHELSSQMARYAKALRPDVLTLMGGPNFPLDRVSQERHLRATPEIDVAA